MKSSQPVGLEEEEKKSSFTEEYIQLWTLIITLNSGQQIWVVRGKDRILGSTKP